MAVYRVNVSFAGNKHSELIDIDAEHPYWQPYIANGYLTPHASKADADEKRRTEYGGPQHIPAHMGITDPENFRLPTVSENAHAEIKESGIVATHDPTPLSAPVVTGMDVQRLRPIVTDTDDEDFGVPV